jgi:anthranilate synthase component 2
MSSIHSKVLVVDCYDSFTFNLVHYLEDILQDEVTVRRIDQVGVADIVAHDIIVFSPGPGLPNEYDHLIALVQESVLTHKRVLGVCLGHQALGMATGAKLKNLTEVHHGVSHPLQISAESTLFSKDNASIMAGRYHSWVIDEATLSADWTITARDKAGEIMAMEKGGGRVCGIQFHPESVLTPNGKEMLRRFLKA